MNFGPTRAHAPNRILIGSAVYAALTVMNSRHTDALTDRAICVATICICLENFDSDTTQ